MEKPQAEVGGRNLDRINRINRIYEKKGKFEERPSLISPPKQGFKGPREQELCERQTSPRRPVSKNMFWL
jgi:hypothetical protein